MKRDSSTPQEAKRVAESKIKKEECRKFLNQPSFVQAGLWYFHKYANVRAQNFHQIYFAADLLKDLGNSLYKQQNIEQAIEVYQEALSVFRFIKPNKDSQKKEELTDGDLEYVSYEGGNEKEKFLLNHIQHILYLNLSIGYIRTKQFSNAIAACTYDLEIDSKSVKSLYRRALARYQMHNKQKWEVDVKLSIKDLKDALQIDENDEDIKDLLCLLEENQNYVVKQPEVMKESILEKKDVPKSEQNVKITNQHIEKKNDISAQKEKPSINNTPIKPEVKESSNKVVAATENKEEKKQAEEEKPKPKMSDYSDYKEYMIQTNPKYAEYYERQVQFMEKQKVSKSSMNVSFESSKTKISESISKKEGAKKGVKNNDIIIKKTFELSDGEDSLEETVQITPVKQSAKAQQLKQPINNSQNFDQDMLSASSSKQSEHSIAQSQKFPNNTLKQSNGKIVNNNDTKINETVQEKPKAIISKSNHENINMMQQLPLQESNKLAKTTIEKQQTEPVKKVDKKKEKKKQEEQAKIQRELLEEQLRQARHAEEIEMQKRKLIELQEQRIKEEKMRQEMLEVELARATLRMRVPEVKGIKRAGGKKLKNPSSQQGYKNQQQKLEQYHQLMQMQQQQQFMNQDQHQSYMNSEQQQQQYQSHIHQDPSFLGENQSIQSFQSEQEQFIDSHQFEESSQIENQKSISNISTKEPKQIQITSQPPGKKPNIKQKYEEDILISKPKTGKINNFMNQEDNYSDEPQVEKDPFAEIPPYIPPNPSKENILDFCEGNSILKQREKNKIFQHSYKSDYQDYLDQKHILDSDLDSPEIPGLPHYRTQAEKRKRKWPNENTTQEKKELTKYQKILLWVAIIIFIFALWWVSGDDPIEVPPVLGQNTEIPSEPFDEFDLLLDD